MKSLVSGLSVSHSCPHPTARNIICRTGTYERTNFSTGQLIYEAAILFNGFSYGPIFLSLFALILAAKFLCFAKCEFNDELQSTFLFVLSCW